MKQTLLKLGFLSLATAAFVGCESDNELDNITPAAGTQNLVAGTCDVINFDAAPMGETITQVYSSSGMGPVMVHNMARNAEGILEAENRAMIFDTGMPTGDDDDLYTQDWGKTLIIQEIGVSPVDDPNVEDDGPNDNRWGGEMKLTFPAGVTLQSIKVLDIDTYEDNSWIYLYSVSGEELYKVKLQPLGNNSKQTVSLGNTEGVTMLKVVLAGTEGQVGSGAIDDIMFCVPAEQEQEETGCTRTQGYWKNHADPGKKQYDATWDDYLNKTFFNSGKDYLAVLNTNPKGGDAYYILAHQYIAAELNVAAGASIPQDVLEAWNAATAYFKGETNPARSELLEWAELLDDYNNGVVGPGHCD
ncbi:hypothetical protein H8S95_15455 [Pontibacter sp. KCTC 32443]|uniref:hypothetical protein n=1 Tax=Pontibacter TaxID=323449 RepID=UPI00164CF548|nr:MULTISPECIES: hypothetical protein [Pontibacter]MBC5775473.1 hypothetical protein [Pontibacter sp. KCTC 32443]